MIIYKKIKDLCDMRQHKKFWNFGRIIWILSIEKVLFELLTITPN